VSVEPGDGDQNQSADPAEEEELPPEGMAWWAEVARAWGPAILAVLAIRTFVFEPFRIPSSSMLPTLLIGDFVVVNKSAYGLWAPATGLEVPFMDMAWVVPRFQLVDLGEPERGDVIVFRYPVDERMTYIKRVVAVGGDRISVARNQITINGEKQTTEFSSLIPTEDKRCRIEQLKHYRETVGEVTHDILMRPGGSALSDRAEVTVPPGHVFVMGDNRDNSQDSRVWKFVSMDQIKGKAHFVWWSYDACQGSVRSDRLFESLYQ